MGYLKSIDIVRANGDKLSLCIYEYKGKYFRDYMYLATEEEMIEQMATKTALFDSCDECLLDLEAVADKQKALITKEYVENY